MTTTQTPDYIKALLTPNKNSQVSRRAWSIDVNSVWVPFFTATNVMGETNLADDVLGAPIRLAKSPDGEVRFTSSGRPVMRVHPDLNSQIGIVRENFVAGLQAYTGAVRDERPDAYGEQVKRAYDAGNPILSQDQKDVTEAVEKLLKEQHEAEHAPESEQESPEAPAEAPRAHTRNQRAPVGAAESTS